MRQCRLPRAEEGEDRPVNGEATRPVKGEATPASGRAGFGSVGQGRVSINGWGGGA